MKSYDTPPLSWDDLVPYLLKSGADILNLSSGNPVIQEEVVATLEQYYRKVLNSKRLRDIVYQYNQPQGYPPLRELLASLYSKEYGIPLSVDNIMITPGSQATFYYISELSRRSGRSVYFPCGPEYPGYRTHPDPLYHMERPLIHRTEDHCFSYRLNPHPAEIPKDLLFMILSSPGNPTGKVFSSQEIGELQEACERRQAYLLIDGAYTRPVPGILFTEMNLSWTQQTILSLSLSKAGLAGERIGVVVASSDIIKSLTEIQTKFSILSPRLVQFVVAEMLSDGTYQRLSQEVILPCYVERYKTASEALKSIMPASIPYYLYKSGGGPFLWLWFAELPQSSNTLFFKLLKKNLIVMPSSVFYLPHLHHWPHAHQCFRIGLIEEPAQITRAIEILSKTITDTYRAKGMAGSHGQEAIIR